MIDLLKGGENMDNQEAIKEKMDELEDLGFKVHDKEKEKSKSKSDIGEGDKLKTTPLLERAREEREGLEKQNDRKEKLLEREEAMMLRQALSGNTEAGQSPKKETEDEKWAKGAKERYEGTGMDPTPNDTPTEFK